MTFRTHRSHLLAAGLLAALCIAAYGRTLGGEFVRWDDGLLIYENPIARGFSLQNIKGAFTTYDPELYIPLTLMSYQLDFMIGGSNPAVYHLHNILLHTFASIAIYASFFLLTKKRHIALLTAVLFAIHPLNTEAVAWLSGRKDVLSTFWFFVALACALHSEQMDDKKWYWLSVAAIALGMLAKATVIVFPAVLLLIDWYQGKPLITKKQIIRYVPYALLSALFLAIAIYGKSRVLGSSNMVEKILMAPRSLAFYLEKIVWPQGLSVLYPWTGDVTLTRLEIFLSITVLTILLATALALWALKKWRLPLFAFALYVVGVSPTLINFAKGDFTYFASDRYAYIGAVGVFFAVAAALDWLLTKKTYHVITAILVFVLLPLSFIQAGTWKDSTALFSNVITHYPTAVVAYNNLGNYERERGNREGAKEYYETAVKLLNDAEIRATQSDRAHAQVLSNYAAVIRDEGDIEQARQLLTEALGIAEDVFGVHMQLGILLSSQSDYETAEWHYRRAMELEPGRATPHVNLGALFMAQGKTEDAIASYEYALAMNPYYPQTWYNLGVAERKRNRPRQALTAYERAVALAPNFVSARINLGILYYERKEVEAAVEQFEAVLQYDPENKTALSALSQIRGQ